MESAKRVVCEAGMLLTRLLPGIFSASLGFLGGSAQGSASQHFLEGPRQGVSSAHSSSIAPIPTIRSMVKASVWSRLLAEKEIVVHASLEHVPENTPESIQRDQNQRRYSFYVAMLVRASVNEARQILTSYPLYSNLVPFVEKAEYSAKTHLLELEGGIWNFMIRSEVLFDEPADRWIHYEIVQGSFEGLTGNIYFESMGEKGTAVYLNGEQYGTRWPPQFVIERGAEIVFELAARRMRSYIESQKYSPGKGAGYGEKGDRESQQPGGGIPQPRSHF